MNKIQILMQTIFERGRKFMIEIVETKQVSIPMNQGFIETMQAGSGDTYVFCAPEINE